MNTIHSITKTIFKGLVVILPLALLVLALYWLFYSLESGLKAVFQWFFPQRYYFHGVGIGLGLILFYAVGLLMGAPFLQRLFQHVQNTLQRIPWIKTLYGGLLDIVEFASVEKRKKFNRVVSVKVGDS